MNYTKKTQDTINFLKSELHNEEHPKMDKYLNYDKIELLKKILNKLI